VESAARASFLLQVPMPMRRIAIFALLALAGLMAASPRIIRCRTLSVHAATHASNNCINNLRQLDGAKQEWFLVGHKSTNDIPTMADIAPFIRVHHATSCPMGGVYSLGRVCDSPRCSLK